MRQSATASAHRHLIPRLALVLAFVALWPQTAAAQPKGDERPLEELAGYVDFSNLGAFPEDDLTVEINLSGSLMRMISAGLKDEDDEFAVLLSKLRRIRVNIFDISERDASRATTLTRDTARRLERDGWETVVRVKDKDSGGDIYIQVRSQKERIVGLVAMFIQPGESAGFINIVGEVDPAQIARIGRQLNIESLPDLEAALRETQSGNKGGKPPAEKGGKP